MLPRENIQHTAKSTLCAINSHALKATPGGPLGWATRSSVPAPSAAEAQMRQEYFTGRSRARSLLNYQRSHV